MCDQTGVKMIRFNEETCPESCRWQATQSPFCCQQWSPSRLSQDLCRTIVCNTIHRLRNVFRFFPCCTLRKTFIWCCHLREYSGSLCGDYSLRWQITRHYEMLKLFYIMEFSCKSTIIMFFICTPSGSSSAGCLGTLVHFASACLRCIPDHDALRKFSGVSSFSCFFFVGNT